MMKEKVLFIQIAMVLLLCIFLIVFSGCTMKEDDSGSVNDTDDGHNETFEVSIAVTMEQEGMVNELTGDGWYHVDDLVSVEAFAAEGYRFVEWTGDMNSTNNPSKFRMPAEHVHLVASFETAPTDDNDTDDGDDPSIGISLKNISLQVNDLPVGYGIFTEDETLAAQFGFVPVGNVSDVYGATFLHGEGATETNVPMVLVSLVYADTIGDGQMLINRSFLTLAETIISLFDMKPMVMNYSIGDEAWGLVFDGTLNETYNFEPAVYTILYVRVDTIVLFLSLQEISPGEMDYEEQTLEYMQIMVDRVNDRLAEKR